MMESGITEISEARRKVEHATSARRIRELYAKSEKDMEEYRKWRDEMRKEARNFFYPSDTVKGENT